MTVLGLNILGDRGMSDDAIVADARSLGAKYHVVMNNPGLAQRLLDIGTNVIYRHWPDDNLQDQGKPREYVRMVDDIAPKGCLIYLGNEPRRSAIPQLNEWTINALDECEKLGRKGVILNFSTGNPEPNEWEALRGSIERAHKGGHILGLHQYFDRSVENSFPWHIGRERDVFAVFGDKTPPIVITELGCAVDFHPLKGWRTVMTSQAFNAELRKAAEHYRQRGIHACLFAQCPENDTSWGTFSPTRQVIRAMSSTNELFQRRADQGGAVSTTTVSTDKPQNIGAAVDAILQTGTFVRVRSTPSLNGTEIAQLMQGQAIKWYPASQRAADNFDWVWVETSTPAGAVNGWMARVWPTFAEQFKPADSAQPIQPDPTETQPAPAVPTALLDELRAIRTRLREIEQQAEKLRLDTQQLGTRLEQLTEQLGKL